MAYTPLTNSDISHVFAHKRKIDEMLAAHTKFGARLGAVWQRTIYIYIYGDTRSRLYWVQQQSWASFDFDFNKRKPMHCRQSRRKPDKGSHAPKIRTIVLNGFAFFTLNGFFEDAFEITVDWRQWRMTNCHRHPFSLSSDFRLSLFIFIIRATNRRSKPLSCILINYRSINKRAVNEFSVSGNWAHGE